MKTITHNYRRCNWSKCPFNIFLEDNETELQTQTNSKWGDLCLSLDHTNWMLEWSLNKELLNGYSTTCEYIWFSTPICCIFIQHRKLKQTITFSHRKILKIYNTYIFKYTTFSFHASYTKFKYFLPDTNMFSLAGRERQNKTWYMAEGSVCSQNFTCHIKMFKFKMNKLTNLFTVWVV